MNTPEPHAQYNLLRKRIVDRFHQADAQCAASIGLAALEPREALERLAWIREWFEAIFPGLGEQLIADRTEAAALKYNRRASQAA